MNKKTIVAVGGGEIGRIKILPDGTTYQTEIETTLIDKFIELDEAGYKFDYYNPNNFLLDEDKGSIEIIDLDKYKAPYKNDLGNALWALTNIEYLNTYLSSYVQS